MFEYSRRDRVYIVPLTSGIGIDNKHSKAVEPDYQSTYNAAASKEEESKTFQHWGT